MYTVLVGLIPVLLRLLVWTISQTRNMEVLNTADFVVFGLILHISSIHQIAHISDRQSSWKTILNGTSIFFITGYGFLFAAYLFGQSNPGLVNQEVTRCLAIGFSVVSFVIGYAVYDRITKLDKGA